MLRSRSDLRAPNGPLFWAPRESLRARRRMWSANRGTPSFAVSTFSRDTPSLSAVYRPHHASVDPSIHSLTPPTPNSTPHPPPPHSRRSHAARRGDDRVPRRGQARGPARRRGDRDQQDQQGQEGQGGGRPQLPLVHPREGLRPHRLRQRPPRCVPCRACPLCVCACL